MHTNFCKWYFVNQLSSLKGQFQGLTKKNIKEICFRCTILMVDYISLIYIFQSNMYCFLFNFIIHEVDENVRILRKRWLPLCMVLNLSLFPCSNMTITRTTHTTSLLKHLFKISYLVLTEVYARHDRLPWPEIVFLVLSPALLCVFTLIQGPLSQFKLILFKVKLNLLGKVIKIQDLSYSSNNFWKTEFPLIQLNVNHIWQEYGISTVLYKKPITISIG